MKVLLVAPPIMDDFWGKPQPIAMDAVRECPPYGIYLLQSVLRQAGHEVLVADLIADGSNSLDRYLTDLADCGLVGIAATSMSWPTATDVIDQVRRAYPEVPIVLGGIHPTMFDHYLLTAFAVDYIVRGEGEIALVALCEALEKETGVENVPNLSWKANDGSIVRNPAGPKIPKTDLGHYPIPDFSLLPMNVYKGLSIESSRGCAFDCSFCSTSYRRSWRGMPADVFVDRLEQMLPDVERTEYKMIHIIDDEFSMNPRRAIEITDVLRARGLRPSLVYDSRATDILYDGFVPSIVEFTGQFLIGAECGYDEGLKRIGKGTTTQILEDAARLLYRHGLSEHADFSFILGLPWETAEEVSRTCRFASHLYATYGVRILLQWYCQIPGSRLWEADRAAGLVSETMYNQYGFFRDLYLFRTGVKLSPEEIWDISRSVEALRLLASVRHGDQIMLEYGHPEPIALHFPEWLMGGAQDGLSNLREVANPAKSENKAPIRIEVVAQSPVSLERPLRHVGP
jgi:anaerobic magnesium-protoporphyrin IX monomethyl ester cyclase